MGRRHRRLGVPRVAYWIAGASIAFAGALTARIVAEGLPPEDRVPIWLVGAAVVFLGLGVLSLGTKARLDNEDDKQRRE